MHNHQKFELIMRQLESFNPSIRLHEKEIEKRFRKLTHTPDHPPYASMIHKAISELNDKEGSSEEAISKFIEAEYDDLPIAHASFLSHHLQKLITKGEIVCTSANCYILSFEKSDSVHWLKKGQKQSRKFRRGKLKGRQHTVKGVQSQRSQRIDKCQERYQVCEKISEGAEEERIGLIGENKEQGDAILIEELNEVEEVQYKMTEELVEDEQYKEAEDYDLMQEQQNQQQMELNAEKSQARKNDEVTEVELQEVQEDVVTEELRHREQKNEKSKESNQIRDPESEVQLEDMQIETMAEQMNSQEQCQVLWQTIEGTAEKHNQEGESHQARKNGEVTETVLQEVREDVVIGKPLHKELRNKTPEAEECNQIQDQESIAREEQVQVADIQIETMVEAVTRTTTGSVSYEEKQLQEQQMGVCCQINDLRDMMVHFLKKEKNDEATVDAQNDTANLKDLFGSSHLTKEEWMELLEENQIIGLKLTRIVRSLNTDVLERYNSKLTMDMQQKKLSEDHLQQTKEPCQKGLMEFSESQPKTILASDSVPTGLMEFEQNCQTELPIYKRPPEVEITSLEGLYREQNKQVKLCDQQKSFKSQPNSMAISLDSSSKLLQDKSENSQVVVERIEMVLEKNRDSPTTEPNINCIGEAAISRPETETSFVDVQFMDSEKLKNSNNCGLEKLSESQLVTSSHNVAMELQAVDLEKQAELQKTKTLKAACLQIPTNSMQLPYLPVPEISAEQEISKACVNVNSEHTVHEHQADLTTLDTSLNLDIQFPVSKSPPELAVQVKEFSTDHTQQITFRDVAITPEFKLGQEQQPENLFEKRPTEHELMAAEHSFQTQKQLPPLSRMPSKAQLTRATSIAKQCRRTKKMPDQQQLRKLRPRGPWPLKHEPVLTTVEADNDLTLASLKAELKQNSEPSINRRAEVLGSRTKVEVSQPTEQESLNRKTQRKQRENSCNQQSGEVKLQVERRGRPPKVKQPDVDCSMRELSVLDHQHHVQQQLPCRSRGRPCKKKTNADGNMKGSPFSDDLNDEQQQRRARGRPPKSKQFLPLGQQQKQ